MPTPVMVALSGVALLLVVEGGILGLGAVDCKKLYGNPHWGGGRAVAKQGGKDYTWAFNPCTPKLPSARCHPPYSGDAYLTQLDYNGSAADPCLHNLFCNEVESAKRNSSTGVVTYQFPVCVPAQTGNGPSPRSATVQVHCDSPTYRVDPVLATKTGNGGYHFTVDVHGPCCACGGFTPPLSSSPVPGLPSALAATPPLYFSQPLNQDSKGGVYDWTVNLRDATEPMVLAYTATGQKTVLDRRASVHSTANGWEFRLTSSEGRDTGRLTVERAAGGGPCPSLSPPVEGITATVNGDLGVEISMTLKCL